MGQWCSGSTSASKSLNGRSIRPWPAILKGNMRDLLFTDTETTGLDIERNEIIEIAAIRTDAKLNILDRFEAKVRPLHPETASIIALQVNGYDAVEWLQARPSSDIAYEWSRYSNGCTLIGKNIGFDDRFLRKFVHQNGIEPLWHYRLVDLSSIAFIYVMQNVIRDISSDALSQYFNIPEEAKPHRAMNGANQALKLFTQLSNNLLVIH
jgi:DNA polymerase-3 subunit epsilon